MRSARELLKSKEVVLLACAGLAHVPLLILHLQRLWGSKEYQFFPFVLVAVVWLIFSRWNETTNVDCANRNCQRLCWLSVVSLVMLMMAVYFHAPWLSAVSLLTIIACCFLKLGAIRHPTNLWGIWALFWLLIPIPAGGTGALTQWLQSVSSRISSEFLDLVRIDHAMFGNSLALPNKRLFVDEACSGIISVMSVIACAAMFAVWKNRNLFHALVLILAGICWAMLMNVGRIASIAIAEALYQMDLSTGLSHDLLGLAVFTLTFVAVMSTDQLLSFSMFPISVRAIWQRGVLQNPFTAKWNAFVNFLRPRVGSTPKEFTPRKMNPPRWSMLVALAFAVLFFYQLGDRLMARTIATSVSTQVLLTLEELRLPSQINGWEKSSERIEKRREAYYAGATSNVAEYESSDGLKLILSLDFPFPSEWHDLTVCYRSIGWKMEERSIKTEVNDWRFVEGAFSGNSRFGILQYSFVDSLGERIQPPSYLAADSLVAQMIARIDRRDPYSQSPDRVQIQAWCQSSKPLSEVERESVQSTFVSFRELVRSHMESNE